MLENIEKSSEGLYNKKPARIITTGAGQSVKPKNKLQKAKQADNALSIQVTTDDDPRTSRCLPVGSRISSGLKFWWNQNTGHATSLLTEYKFRCCTLS